MAHTTKLKPKVSIIGCGNVGMRYAYALTMQGLVRSLVITDLDQKRLEGEVMDLSHGAPYASPIKIIAGEYSDIKDSDLVVITAGKKQKSGQSRIELVKDNLEVFRQIIAQVVKYAPSAVYLVVTNPVDILSYATYKFSSKPAHEVIGSGTVLDTARFRFLLGQHCQIDPHNVHGYVLGEHGDSEFPVWSNTIIGGVPFESYGLMGGRANIDHHKNEMEAIGREVKESAYKIIDLKGETSYGIGLSLVRITRAILHDENAVLPVSTLIDDYLGIKDIYLSLPSVVNKNGVRENLKIELSSLEQNQFLYSAEKIKGIIKQVGL